MKSKKKRENLKKNRFIKSSEKNPRKRLVGNAMKWESQSEKRQDQNITERALR